MQFTEDAQVFTRDQHHVGRITHVVLNPVTKKITHVVVRGGVTLLSDKLIPLEMFEVASPEVVILHSEMRDLWRLPKFEEVRYRLVEHTPAVSGPELVLEHGLPAQQVFNHHTANSQDYPLPDGTVALKEGAQVISMDHQCVGTIETVLTVADSAYATHIVLSTGSLTKSRKLVPTAWFGSVEEDTVHLAVEAALLKQLVKYD